MEQTINASPVIGRSSGDAMNWLKKLPGFQRSAHGFEWALWKRLPGITIYGTAMPILLALLLWWTAPDVPTYAQQRELMLAIYQLIGLVILVWSLLLTVAIGCAIIVLMKGPAYVADAYPPPGRE